MYFIRLLFHALEFSHFCNKFFQIFTEDLQEVESLPYQKVLDHLRKMLMDYSGSIFGMSNISMIS